MGYGEGASIRGDGWSAPFPEGAGPSGEDGRPFADGSAGPEELADAWRVAKSLEGLRRLAATGECEGALPAGRAGKRFTTREKIRPLRSRLLGRMVGGYR